MPSLVYCTEDFGTWQQQQCEEWTEGGIRGFALLKSDQTDITDFTNATQWNTAITNGNAIIISGAGIKGEIPLSSTDTVESPTACATQDTPVRNQHTITFTDANINTTNDATYAAISGQQYYVVPFLCSTDEILVYDILMTVLVPPANVPSSNSEFSLYNITMTGTATLDWYPVRYDAPTGIFS